MARRQFKIFYNNLWKSATLYHIYNEHPEFVAANTQNRMPSQSWRTNYGGGSGWGEFIIVLNDNDQIIYEETLGVPLTTTLTPGQYNADELASHIQTQLNLIGASNYTVDYLESGSNANKFRITSDGAGGGGIFSLSWGSGSRSDALGETIGFDVSSADTGLLTYTADYIAIYSQMELKADLGSAYEIEGFFAKNHNLQSGGVFQIEAAQIFDFSVIPFYKTVTNLGNNSYGTVFGGLRNYRYWRPVVDDPTNPDLYSELGSIFIGGAFTPSRYFRRDRDDTPTDPSLLKMSTGGQYSSIQLPHYRDKTYFFPMSDEKTTFDTVFAAVGTSKELWIVENSQDWENTTYMVRIKEYRPVHQVGDFWDINLTFETLR